MEWKSAEIIATLRYTLFRTLLKEIATVLLGQIRKDSMRYVFALDREHEDARFASRVFLALVSMFFWPRDLFSDHLKMRVVTLLAVRRCYVWH